MSEGLPYRDATGDWDHVPSRIAAGGRDDRTPFVTIAITTYKRSDLLIESVQSALAQDFARPFEVIILDNDPDSRMAAWLGERVPALADRSFRYFVNAENLGVFGNFNRCITLARGEWLTILNDDDLLDANYLRTMFEELGRRPSIDGIVCIKRLFGGVLETPGAASADPMRGETMSGSTFAALLKTRAGRRSLFHRVFGRMVAELSYRGRASRRIRAGKFFWGAVLGNGAGFLFRRDKALEIGGFYPEEYPSADLWFFARIAERGHLRQHRAAVAAMRLTEGSISVQTLTEQLDMGYRLQRILAGTAAPRWFRRLLPTMIEQYRVDFEHDRETPVPKAEVEQALGIRLPPHRPRLYALSRLLLGGL